MCHRLLHATRLAAALPALHLLALLSLAPSAQAQQSNRCVTPVTTCRAVYAGPKNAPCSCRTPQGWVRGRLG